MQKLGGIVKLIGSVFAVFVAAAGAAHAQDVSGSTYGGPAILSRGTGAGVSTAGALVGIRPFGSLFAVYDGGLTPVSVNNVGDLLSYDGSGVEIGFGVQGFKRWRHTVLALNYGGTYRHYPNQQFFNGTDQNLGLSVAHEFSRRWALNFRTNTGSLMRGFRVDDVLGTTRQQDSLVNFNDPFDNRINFTNSSVNFIYTPSLRWSFSFGGGGFLVRRRSASLFGTQGVVGNADFAYRINRRQTIGVSYAHNRWKFTRGYGESEFNFLGLNYSIQLARSWELAAQAGGYRLHNTGIGTVPLDPAVAEILGTTTGFVAFDRTNYLPGFSARLTRRFQRASLTFDATSNLTPGNSVFLTSRQQAVGASYSYDGVRDWSFRFFTGYSTWNTMMQDPYQTYNLNFGTGVTRRLIGRLQLNLDAQMRRLEIKPQSNFTQNFVRVSGGLYFSPGEVPISRW